MKKLLAVICVLYVCFAPMIYHYLTIGRDRDFCDSLLTTMIMLWAIALFTAFVIIVINKPQNNDNK